MQTRSFQLMLALAPLAIGFALALDIYVPSVPHILREFDSSQATVQLTLSCFTLFVGAGQLVFGPIADAVGRRKVVIVSVLVFLIGSILCAFATSIAWLIIARVIEAIGACGMMVIAFAVVRDCYDAKQSARYYGYLNGAVSVSPMIAPVLGGYLQVWFGWRSAFLFLVIYAVITFFLILRFLPETLPQESRMSFDLAVFKRYLQIIRNTHFLVFTFGAGSAVACFFVFFSMSSYLLIDILRIPTQDFGYYFLTLGITTFIGALICAAIAPKIGVLKTAVIGAVLVVIGGLLCVLWLYLIGLTVAGFLMPMVFIGVGGAFMLSAGAAGALAPFKDMAGTAAALLGSIQFMFSSAFGAVVMIWPVHTTMPLAVTALALGALTLVGYYFVRTH